MKSRAAIGILAAAVLSAAFLWGQDVTFRASQTTLTIALFEGRTYLLRTLPGKPPEFEAVTIAYIRLDDLPPVVPPPPGPVDPPKPPAPSGARQVLIIRETADATPAVARLVVGLRAGPAADYLRSKGHTLQILDDDSVDAQGNKPKVLSDHAADIAAIGLPCVLVLDSAGAVVAKAKLPGTAAEVVDLVKANGG